MLEQAETAKETFARYIDFEKYLFCDYNIQVLYRKRLGVTKPRKLT